MSLDGYGVFWDDGDNLRHYSCKSFIEFVEEGENWVHLRCNRCKQNEFIPLHHFYPNRDPNPNFTFIDQSRQWYHLKGQGHL